VTSPVCPDHLVALVNADEGVAELPGGPHGVERGDEGRSGGIALAGEGHHVTTGVHLTCGRGLHTEEAVYITKLE
jgi:hypothetical protein